MFIRTKLSSNQKHTKVQIVENLRQGNIIRQKIVRHVGTAFDETELVQLKRLAQYAMVQIQNDRQTMLFPPEEIAALSLKFVKKVRTDPVHVEDLYEESRSVVGIHDVFGQVYEGLGFDHVLPNPARHRLSCAYLRHITMARIACPSSKWKAVASLAHMFGVSLNLDKVYQLMDKIDDRAGCKL